MDLILMINALCFLVIFPICWVLARLQPRQLFWRWLGLFGLFHGLSILLTLLRLSIEETPELANARVLLLGVSFLCLMEFSRRAMAVLGLRRITPLIHLPFIALALLCVYKGMPGLRYALGFPGALWAAWTFWQLWRADGSLPKITKASAICLALYAVVAGLIATSQTVFPNPLNYPPTFHGNHHVQWIQWIRATCAIILATSLWRIYWHRYGRNYPALAQKKAVFFQRLLGCLLITILLGGWLGAAWIAQIQNRRVREDLFQQTRQAGIVIDTEKVHRLAWNTSDLNSPDYYALKKWLQALREVIPRNHFAYITGLRDGRLYLLATSAATDSADSAFPGLLNQSVPPALADALQQSGPSVVGPLGDARGNWIIGCYPLPPLPGDTTQDRVTFHLDMPAAKLDQLVTLARLPVLLLTLITCVMALGLTGVWARLRLISASQLLELERVQRQEAAISRMSNSPARAAGNFATAVREIAQLTADALEVERVSIWLADDHWSKLECATLFQLTKEAFENSPPLQKSQYPSFFQTVSTGKTIEAPDACNNVLFTEFVQDHLKPLGITSLITVPFYQDARVAGLLCIEHVGQPRFWMTDECRFAGEIADTIAHAFSNKRRMETEMALAASERHFREFVEVLPQIVYETDMQGKFTTVNKAAYSLTGYTPEDVRNGLGIFDICVPSSHPKILEGIKKLMEGDPPRGQEYPMIRKDESIFYGLTYNTIRCTQDGKPAGFRGIVVDITDRKRMEETLRETHKELESNYESLVVLLRQQEVNIDLAQQVLSLINSRPQRHTPLPDQLDLYVTSHYISCHAAGGDHFFVQNLESPDTRGGRTVLSLKDQSGHEVGCILRSIVTDLLHNALLRAPQYRSLDAVFTRLNDLICASNLFKEDVFFTSINAEIDHASRQMRFLSTGHPPCLLIRGNAVQLLPESHSPGANMPVGVIGGREFTAGQCQLEPGDKLIFYTDGIFELSRRAGEPSPDSRALAALAQQCVREHPGQPVSWLISQLLRSLLPAGSNEASSRKDDVAVLGLEIETLGQTHETVMYPNCSENLSTLIKDLTQVISQEWLDHKIENPEQRLRLALEEALVNAWKHGNNCDPNKSITVRRRYGNDAVITVSDQGPGFAHEGIYDPSSFENRTKASGRGLFIIRLISDEVTWRDQGRTIVICFQNRAYPAFSDSPTQKPVQLLSLDLWKSEGF